MNQLAFQTSFPVASLSSNSTFVTPLHSPRSISTYRRKRSSLQSTNHAVTARVRDSTALETAFLSALDELKTAVRSNPPELHRYRQEAPSQFEQVITCIEDLEKSVSGFGASVGYKFKSFIPGTWELVVTNSKAVEKNAGSITGLGSLPGAKCIQVKVQLEKDGKARTVEKVKVFGGLVTGNNALEGKWRLTGKQASTLEVTYAQAVLMDKAKLRADSKAVLNTTYCSAQIRIGRSPSSNDFYVFIRV